MGGNTQASHMACKTRGCLYTRIEKLGTRKPKANAFARLLAGAEKAEPKCRECCASPFYNKIMTWDKVKLGIFNDGKLSEIFDAGKADERTQWRQLRTYCMDISRKGMPLLETHYYTRAAKVLIAAAAGFLTSIGILTALKIFEAKLVTDAFDYLKSMGMSLDKVAVGALVLTAVSCMLALFKAAEHYYEKTLGARNMLRDLIETARNQIFGDGGKPALE